MKIGRNDPCPCGSGKKFKKCCLGKSDVPGLAPSRRTAEASVDSLRTKIIRFMEKKGFKDHYPAAVSQYWKTLDERVEPRRMTDKDVLGLTEWFIHDYVLPDYGKPLISVFLESNPNLTREERQILEDWQKTNISVFQITRVEQNHGVHAEDIFTGEEFFLHDISISRAVEQWQLFVCRKVWVLNEWQASAVGTALPPDEKNEIYDFVMDHYRGHLKKNPGASLSDFLQEKGYLLRQYLLTREMVPEELPKFITSHGEEIVFLDAIYDVIDHDSVIDKLSAIQDYQMTGQTQDEDGEVLHYTFDWLERGKSAKLFKEEYPQKGIALQSFHTAGPGHESHRVLGNLEVYSDRLKLSVIGEKRFKVGKGVLEKTLKGAVKHRVDSIQTLESKRKEGKKPPEPERIDPETREEILRELFDEHYRKWLDSKIPALGGKTPREAAKTKAGRKELEDLLRVLEYREERRRETGEPEYDVSWIRRELGMAKK